MKDWRGRDRNEVLGDVVRVGVAALCVVVVMVIFFTKGPGRGPVRIMHGESADSFEERCCEDHYGGVLKKYRGCFLSELDEVSIAGVYALFADDAGYCKRARLPREFEPFDSGDAMRSEEP